MPLSSLMLGLGETDREVEQTVDPAVAEQPAGKQPNQQGCGKQNPVFNK